MTMLDSAYAVNLDLDPDLDFNPVSDAPSADDLAWAAYHLNDGRADYFVPGEFAPLPSGADAPADAPDPDGDELAVGAAYRCLDDLLLGRPVSIRRYNAARTALAYDPLPAECACLDEPHCSCGNRLWAMGLKAYERDARERLASYNEWLDSIAPPYDPDELDRLHCDRACFH